MSERRVLARSVSKATRRTYKSMLRHHRSLGYKRSFKGLKKRFLRFDGTDPRTLNNVRFAVQWHRRVHGKSELTPGQKENLRQLLRGRRDIMGDRKPKGVIKFKRLQALLCYMEDHGAGYALRLAVAIAWGTGLRTSQMTTLRRSNFRNVDGKWVVEIEECHKRDQGERSRKRWVMQPTEPRVQELLDAHLASLGQNQRVCPSWKPAVVNDWIKRAARALHWSKKFNWAGAHQLRHGVAYETERRTSEAEAARLLGHTRRRVRGATRIYTEPGSARLRRYFRRQQRRSGNTRRKSKRSERKSKRSRRRSKKAKKERRGHRH